MCCASVHVPACSGRFGVAPRHVPCNAAHTPVHSGGTQPRPRCRFCNGQLGTAASTTTAAWRRQQRLLCAASLMRGGEPGPRHGTLHSRWHAGAQRWRPPFGASAAAIAAWPRWQWLLCVAGKRPCCGRARAKPYIACVATSPTGHTLKAAAPWSMEHSWNTPRLGTSVFHNDHWNTAPRCGKLNTGQNACVFRVCCVDLSLFIISNLCNQLGVTSFFE